MNKVDRIVFTVVGVFLVITFVGRLFPVDEKPGRTVRVLSIVFDVGMTVGLVGLGTKILKATPQGTPGRSGWILLFGAGIISVMGIFAIHLTGGQRVEWAPRTTPLRSAFTDTPRPEETVDFTKGGEALAAAVETIRERFGSERIFKKITISRTSLGIRVRDPKDPKLTVSYGCNLNGLRESPEFMSAEMRKLTEGELHETELFR